MVVGLIAAFLIPVILSLVFTPYVIRFAHKIGAMDAPGGRKIHKTITPRLGGLAIVGATVVSSAIVYAIFPVFFYGIQNNWLEIAVVGFCLISIFALGFWDDLKPLSPGLKFGVQFIAAVLVYAAGFKISVITNPIGSGFINIELIEFPITLLWIVGITNAFNLIDGLDGLASGVAAIASVSIFLVSMLAGEIWMAVTALIFAGALVGFLRYNFRPAQIFLGDSGSLFIGFSLALLSIQSATKISTGFALLFPLLVLGLPIADTLVSMIRRILGSFLHSNPQQKVSLMGKLHSMFLPDRSHIHHQLVSLGLTHRNTVILLYLVSAVFAAGAFALTQFEDVNKSILTGLVLIFIIIAGIKNLRYREISIFNNGLLMPFYEKWVLTRTTYLSLIDVTFMAIAYCFSYLMVYSLNPEVIHFSYFNQIMVAVVCVQLSTFWLSGVYRESIRQMGIGNAIALTASVFYALVATAFILLAADIFSLLVSLQFLILNFYFLLTLVLGFRISYRALVFWFNKEKNTGEKIIIYGANENGAMMLRTINNTKNSSLKVVGFMDDDPQLEGKVLNGYPIFGNHWQLHKILKKQEVNCIFICEKSIKPENFKRLSMLAAAHDIQIKGLQMRIEKINSTADSIPLVKMPTSDDKLFSYI